MPLSARKWLVARNVFSLRDRNLTVTFLIRVSDWRPLKAPWWRKKQASIIAADLEGNFFLRHCDGSVRYWDHSARTDINIAASVSDLCAQLTEPAATDCEGQGRCRG